MAGCGVWSCDGRDRLPDLLDDERALATLEEASLFGTAWLRALRAIPNEYLYYFYFQREAIRSIREQPATRGEFLVRQQADFYAAALRRPDQALALWRSTVAERSALYMAEAKGRPHEAPEPDRTTDPRSAPRPATRGSHSP